MDDALAAITRPQAPALFARGARLARRATRGRPDKTWRADAVFIAPGRWPRHIEAAFELEMF